MKKRNSNVQVSQVSSLRIAFKNTGELQRLKLAGPTGESTNKMRNKLPAADMKAPDFTRHYIKPKRFDFF